MKRKHNEVVYHESGSVTINGRTYTNPTAASAGRLVDYIWERSVQRVVTPIGVVHTVRR